jgi:hypothetical protein
MHGWQRIDQALAQGLVLVKWRFVQGATRSIDWDASFVSAAGVLPAAHRGKKSQHQSLEKQSGRTLQQDDFTGYRAFLQELGDVSNVLKTKKTTIGNILGRGVGAM